MCAIIGSSDVDKLSQLIDLNSYRGSHSYSFSVVNKKSMLLEIYVRGWGEFDKKFLRSMDGGSYGIAHVQAPTSDKKDITRVHPSLIKKGCLWHNGILKQEWMKQYAHISTWDTAVLLYLIQDSITNLNNIDGTFSCLYYTTSKLYLFRNEISPMFYDPVDLTISSTKFDGSISTPSNQVLEMDFDNNVLYNTYSFKTKENPYYFFDEVNSHDDSHSRTGTT